MAESLPNSLPQFDMLCRVAKGRMFLGRITQNGGHCCKIVARFNKKNPKRTNFLKLCLSAVKKDLFPVIYSMYTNCSVKKCFFGCPSRTILLVVGNLDAIYDFIVNSSCSYRQVLSFFAVKKRNKP
jgi:hypothetical protein